MANQRKYKAPKIGYCDDCQREFVQAYLVKFVINVEPACECFYCEDCADGQIDYYGRSGYKVVEKPGKVTIS